MNGEKGEIVNDLIDGEKLQFIRIGAREYVYGRQSKKLSTDAYKQKMRMSPSITDLIDNASISYDAPDHKNHKLFPNGFKNYQGHVGVDDTIFKYIVRIGKSADGNVFYDINLETDGKVPRAKRTSLMKMSASDDSIRQNDGIVNTSDEKKSLRRWIMGTVLTGLKSLILTVGLSLVRQELRKKVNTPKSNMLLLAGLGIMIFLTVHSMEILLQSLRMP